MSEKNLSALFLDTLKDIYYAEKQIYKSLPKMAKVASSDQLRNAFEKHHDETEGHIERLEKIFDLLGKPARGKKCDAIEGILVEGEEIMDEYKDAPVMSPGPSPCQNSLSAVVIARVVSRRFHCSPRAMKRSARLPGLKPAGSRRRIPTT